MHNTLIIYVVMTYVIVLELQLVIAFQGNYLLYNQNVSEKKIAKKKIFLDFVVITSDIVSVSR